jgi:acyl carrier protein
MSIDTKTVVKFDLGEQFHIAEKVLASIKEFVSDYSYTTGDIYFHESIESTVDKFGLDSLDTVELIMFLEQEFNVELPDDKAENCRTVADLTMLVANYVMEKKANNCPVCDQIPENGCGACEDDETEDDETEDAEPLSTVGLLILPSLVTAGEFINIHPISLEEATELVNDFTKRVESQRKTKIHTEYDEDTDHIEFYHNVIDFSQMDKETIEDPDQVQYEINSLATSTIPTKRGTRAVFISAGAIGVGTTVVFNQNWATMNFSDYTIFKKLQEIQEKFTA